MAIYFTVFICITLVLFNQSVWSRSISPNGNVSCSMDYDGQALKEGQSVEIKGKLYKMEECGLQRAYHACGSYLMQMVSIACELIGHQKQKKTSSNRVPRFVPRKLLTEACCETLCTVAEMTRYCPQY